MQIRLIAIDIDDTLLNSSGAIPPRVMVAIDRARWSGVAVTLATGRMFVLCAPYAHELGLSEPLVTYNGALLRDIQGKVYFHRPVPRNNLLDLVNIAREGGYCLNLYVDDCLYTAQDGEATRYYTSLGGISAHFVGDLTAFVQQLPTGVESTKALIVADEDEVAELLPVLKQRFLGRLEVSCSKNRLIEMTASGVSKGTALEQMAKAMNLSSDRVMAVGDSFNDLPMLEYAGLGVAVANAPDTVRNSVDAVVSSNDDDGVAEAIERFVLDSDLPVDQ